MYYSYITDKTNAELCVRLAQTGQAYLVIGHRQKQFPPQNIPLFLLVTRLTMTFLQTRSEKGHQFTAITFMGRQRLLIWDNYPLDK